MTPIDPTIRGNEKRFVAEECIMVFLSNKGNSSIDIVDTHRPDGEVYITITSFDHDLLIHEVEFLLSKLNEKTN